MELQDHYREIRDLGAEVVVLSVDDQDLARSAKDEWSLEFPVLYDADTSVAKEWGVYDLLDDGLAAPSTFIFNAEGDLSAYRIGSHIADRPTADDVVATLREGAPPDA